MLTRKLTQDETVQPGPYNEIKEADVFINCIYLSKPIPPFISMDFLKQGTRNLSVVYVAFLPIRFERLSSPCHGLGVNHSDTMLYYPSPWSD